LKISKTSFVFAIAWLILITILLCIPGKSLPRVSWSDKIWLDKWVHVFLFLALVLVWCKAYKIVEVEVYRAKKIFIIITVLSIFYGILMEIIQHYFIPFRSFDIGDMIADSIGAVIGYFISGKQLKKN